MKNKKDRPVIAVPPGMAQWVEEEAQKLGLVFMSEITEVDPTAPGHDFESEITVLPPHQGTRLRFV